MNDSVFERMKEVDAAVKKLDPAVRDEAFGMMRDYILEGSESQPSRGGVPEGQDGGSDRDKGARAPAPSDFDAFIDRFESDTPADNALAIAGYLYGQYGIEPLSVQEIKDLAEKAGTTIPARIDMTLGQKNWTNKKAFRKTSKGHFRPTVVGEAYLKETFSVKKGTKKRPKTES